MKDIAVTGSTGHIGRRVAETLSKAGVPLRLLVRDLSKAPDLSNTTVFGAAYEHVRVVREALTGVDTVFMVSVTEDSRRLDVQSDFIAAAAQADVKHIVYLSFAGADINSKQMWERDHGLSEQLIEELGIKLTTVRPHHFDATMLDFAMWGNIRGPGGSGRINPVARTDVAAAIAAILLDPEPHIGQSYRLTGPQSISFPELAQIITDTTGTLCTYVDESVEEYLSRMNELSVPGDLRDAWLGQWQSIMAGDYDVVTDDVERLTGRPARPLSETLPELV